MKVSFGNRIVEKNSRTDDRCSENEEDAYDNAIEDEEREENHDDDRNSRGKGLKEQE